MTSLYVSVENFLQNRFFRWVDKYTRSREEYTLNRKNLYIFPTFRGFIFFVLIVVLWLLGTNYQNNLILSLSFFLISVFIVAILQTHQNLVGLKVKLVGAEPSFAGENADFIFSVSCKHDLENISIKWRKSATSARVIDVVSGKNTSVTISHETKHRGWVDPGRLYVYSYYPLGLMRCWTYLNFDAKALVYPAPIEVAEPPSSEVETDNVGEFAVKGGEDFSGLSEYRPGDSLRHISWKSFARERGLHVKEFSQTMSKEIWLDINNIAGEGVEQRLSALCYWSLQYQLKDMHYGLRLNDLSIEPNKGEDHKRKVLEALALFS